MLLANFVGQILESRSNSVKNQRRTDVTPALPLPLPPSIAGWLLPEHSLTVRLIEPRFVTYACCFGNSYVTAPYKAITQHTNLLTAMTYGVR